MIPPVRCYTCGMVLGDKYEYYKKELNRKKLALNDNKDPLIIDISVDDVKKTIAGEIMDELGVIRLCCRKVFFTSIEIIDEI
jgi:DNA-directed RNA polymerase subunit N